MKSMFTASFLIGLFVPLSIRLQILLGFWTVSCLRKTKLVGKRVTVHGMYAIPNLSFDELLGIDSIAISIKQRRPSSQ